ncbi:hypothetical protein B0T26DRAFT_647722, partial [Lasiosphaeria miniovina]
MSAVLKKAKTGFRSKAGQKNPFNTFLRAVGISSLCFLPCFRQDKGGREKPKVVIQHSLALTLAQLSIHILPAIASVLVIYLNLATLYLGRTLPGPILNTDVTNALLQICAKIHELLIMASLTTIVFTFIRNEITIYDGLPLGFLCSGFMFNNIGYFWSSEFWGAATSRLSPRAKISMITVLVIAGLIAATAGPSAAVLLIPRLQDWNGGGSLFYLRGSASDLFPDILIGSNLTTAPVCSGPNAINYGMCPSGSFLPLSAYISSLRVIKNQANIGPPPKRISGLFGGIGIDIASVTPLIPQSHLVGELRGIACQTAAIAPYLPVLMYQNRLWDDFAKVAGNISWNSNQPFSSSNEYAYDFGRYPRTSTNLPVVRSACSIAQNISSGIFDISFPVMPIYSCWDETQSLFVVDLNNTPSNNIRVTWTTLPAQFGSTSTGMIFEAPWVNNQSSRVVIGCSFDARWATGGVDASEGLAIDLGPFDQWKEWSQLNTVFRPPNTGRWAPITLDKTWLQLLTPYSTSMAQKINSNLSTLEILLSNYSAIIDGELTKSDDQTHHWNQVAFGSSNRTLFLEWVTALLLVDGISRHYTSQQLNMTGSISDWDLLDYNLRPDWDSQLLAGGDALELPPPEIGNFTTFLTVISILGLSYQAQNITDYLAISVLLAHIFLALGHTLYLLWHRKSSVAWDSIPEMLVLAHNSRSSGFALKNTSAGIRSIETFRRIGMVR